MSAITQWFNGIPPAAGWWDTKATDHWISSAPKEYEVRLWWNGNYWRISPNSPSYSFVRQDRQWRGLADKPKGPPND